MKNLKRLIFGAFVFLSLLGGQIQTSRAADGESNKGGSNLGKPRSFLTIPSVAQGHEDAYEQFLTGKLVYKKDGKEVTFLIKDLDNPLGGRFNLSGCGDEGDYFVISTGCPEGKKEEKGIRGKIWIAPEFLARKKLAEGASYLKSIVDKWEQNVPVGLLWTWEGWEADKNDMCHLVTKSLDDLSKVNLYENWKKGTPAQGNRVGPTRLGEAFTLHFSKEENS